jgi:hypothetical protein
VLGLSPVLGVGSAKDVLGTKVSDVAAVELETGTPELTTGIPELKTPVSVVKVVVG